MIGWTFDQWLAVLAVVALPVSGIIVAMIANRRSKQTPPPHPVPAVVPGTPAAVTEHQAHVAEISVIIDGFTASHRALTEDFERVRGEARECRETTSRLESMFRQSEKARVLERQMMIDHIEILEALIPVPPGAPTRPVWGD